MAYFAEGLDTVDKVLVSILLLVVTDGFRVVFKLGFVVSIGGWTWRSLLLLFSLMEDLTRYRKSLIDWQFRALELRILVPFILAVIFRTSFHPALILTSLGAEEHSLVL